MTLEIKNWIDNADYETLLRRNRFTHVGDTIFLGASGTYYSKIMNEKRLVCPNPVEISKQIGWK